MKTIKTAFIILLFFGMNNAIHPKYNKKNNKTDHVAFAAKINKMSENFLKGIQVGTSIIGFIYMLDRRPIAALTFVGAPSLAYITSLQYLNRKNKNTARKHPA